jgi:ubiquinone/menaquinone biosynthesis C-methylase UbiE
MKLSETELQELAKQLHCPSGKDGIKVGEMMNFTNNNIINKTIHSLNLKKGEAVLEIGPGNGVHISELFKIIPDLNYTGIDISKTMVSQAKTLNSGLKNVSFHLTEGKTIEFKANKFDKIFTVNTIYFWQNPQEYATEITRVLKPGGKLAIGFIPETTMQKIPFAKYGFTHYSISAVSALIERTGLTVTSAVTATEIVMSNSGNEIEREFVIMTAEKLL